MKCNKLIGLRVQFELTQVDMSNKLGMNVSVYQRKEAGVTQFKLSEVKQVITIMSEKAGCKLTFEQIF